MASTFYSGMKGPEAIVSLNTLWDASVNVFVVVGEAETAATTATTQATAAATSATNAATSATNATTQATAAATSATNAATSATAAAASYDSFDDRYLGSKASNPTLDNDGTALLTGAIYWNTVTPEMRVWTGSAWVAVQSTSAATAAATSATNAATSATTATTQATAASTSATNAATSATTATTQATAAATSATTATTQATAAATSATTATTQATAASTSATNAAASYDSFDDRYLGSKATNPTVDNDGAALLIGAIYWNTATPEMRVWNGTAWVPVQSTTAATNAANSATAAATSATNAATSATNAATSATSAAASYDSFDDRYLGSKATNPTVDNDGAALLLGAIYWNTATPEMRVWNGTAWVPVQSTTAATNAANSATAAATSATNAATSASTATTQATNATTQATNAATSATGAANSSTLAQNWAIQLVTPVASGEYSAKYWAQQAAATLTGSLVYRGSWDASTNMYPPTPVTGDYYKVSVAGTTSGTAYDISDSIIYNGSSWDKIDNSETSIGIASDTTLGLIKVGSGLSITAGGVLTASEGYVHPVNHPASIITQDANNRFVTDAEIAIWDAKLDASAAYVHPVNHPASIITQDANNRFVTDAEIAAWDAKQPAGTYATGTGTASGTNTGDETLSSIKTKLGITTLSGTNTGDQDLSGKQNVLVSGTNIKTVNGSSIVGSGDLTISAGATITDDTATNTTQYLGMSRVTTGAWTTAYTASSKLYFTPSTGTLSSTVFNSLSDVTKKTNIISVQNATNTINKLTGVEFDWIDNSTKSSGVIAQELEKVLPHLVTETDGVKSVNYNGIIAYLIEANKELHVRLLVLENS